MTIDASCPNCGTVYTVRRDLIGKRTKCTRCGTPFVIAEMAPAQAAPPSPPQPPAASPSAVPDQLLYGDIPIHQSYSPQSIRPVAEQAPAQQIRTGEYVGLNQDNARPRFPVMRIVARSSEITAAIVMLFGVYLLFDLLFSLVSPSTGMMGPSPFTIALGVVGAVSMALMLLFAAQSIRLGLQIEQNTRETSEACRQLAEHLTSIQTEQ